MQFFYDLELRIGIAQLKSIAIQIDWVPPLVAGNEIHFISRCLRFGQLATP